MRRASTRLALLGLAVATLGLPAAAGAAPNVTLKVKIVPVPVNPSAAKSPTYPGTGSILGAGAAVEAEYQISGTEYGGFPLPLKQVTFFLPAGAKLHTQGFVKCPEATLQAHEVQKCPAKSIASPKGSVSGVVSFGNTRVHETLTLQAFFAAKGLAFFAEGTSPASIEILTLGSFAPASGLFSQKFVGEVPLVATVPGAPYASVETIKVKVGAAIKQGKKLISYGTVPKKCPKGGFKIKSELTFGATEGPTGETVSVNTTVPCPKK
jgi:hypothetical protein